MATTDGTKRRPARRTRIVCISDTHNSTVKLPPGDILIHAGDITNQGSYSELSKAVKWLEGLPYEAKIIVAGNHDITLDADFYARHGNEFHNKKPESHEECLALLKNSPALTYLRHETVTVRLSSPTGPRTELSIFGSPLAPAFHHWAFYYPPYYQTSRSHDEPCPESVGLDDKHFVSPWDDIPARADVVVTHTPPRGHCDDRGGVDRPAGCEALRRALWRVRPRLAVCGHMHEGRGVSRVRWDLYRAYGELDDGDGAAPPWQDPGAGINNKISLVDLTTKKAIRPLDNDGLWCERGSGTTASSVGGGGGQALDDAKAPGWHGRRETCVVNAAILKSKFPHAGGKQFYKPIVVDLDLPVVDES
ncbi:ser/Thr protein phosphatase [Cordyceps fumosorosea ARSEF 2679]|uniref:Ser/Thr protein phosphatase n=1 Tax=Cordyceps fumosorosea (strain ARSEF 2679) TaxID=1081104 RepID=A0A162MXY7_CORFA|nr:ser/Thr protein phosphatase [Cordyceps fumosorosea ARSEF 2679]OAA72409.1 ser/Thr protein phosphatase [Cordyceps fumosorosea ARSEF 2679]